MVKKYCEQPRRKGCDSGTEIVARANVMFLKIFYENDAKKNNIYLLRRNNKKKVPV